VSALTSGPSSTPSSSPGPTRTAPRRRASFAEKSDKEGWPAARLLTVIAENELAERDRRRIERHLAEAKLLAGKTLDNFDFNSVPMVSKAQVAALCAGDEWLRNGANVLLLGPPEYAT
jgi:DNA replication protein DnaC